MPALQWPLNLMSPAATYSVSLIIDVFSASFLSEKIFFFYQREVLDFLPKFFPKTCGQKMKTSKIKVTGLSTKLIVQCEVRFKVWIQIFLDF